eukprot:12535717-Alexandrium_andersonii.AAC.1
MELLDVARQAHGDDPLPLLDRNLGLPKNRALQVRKVAHHVLGAKELLLVRVLCSDLVGLQHVSDPLGVHA